MVSHRHRVGIVIGFPSESLSASARNPYRLRPGIAIGIARNMHTKPKPKTQVPIRIKLPPEMEPAEKRRYRQRTTVERAYSRLKDEFGARTVRVRGPQKVFAHLMFGVLALTVDRLLKIHK